MSNLDPVQSSLPVHVEMPTSWKAQALVRKAEVVITQEKLQAATRATRIRCSAALGDELMTALDQLRRHEARSAAEDPVIADEYAAIRRAVFHAGLTEIERYGTRL